MAMNAQTNLLKTMLTTMSDAELDVAWGAMKEEYNYRSDRRALKNRRMLRKGSIVEWVGTKSGSCTGEVTKVKRKKALDKQTSRAGSPKHFGMTWDIPMSMLTVVG